MRSHALRTRSHIAYEPDARIDDVLIEVSRGASSFRNVRATLLALAYRLADDATAKAALIVLADTRITQPRLERELALLGKVVKPEFAKRLHFTIESGGRYTSLPANLPPDFPAKLAAVVRVELAKSGLGKGPAKSSEHAILEIRIHEWFLAHGPLTTDRLMKISGSSYPTVARALKRYDDILVRQSDRRVELRHFPLREWSALVTVSGSMRSTTLFTDRSGQPRSPEAMFRRLRRRNYRNIAVGGVIAARNHYLPSLDLAGTPRLDLTVDATAGVDWDFINDLDPALRKAERKDEPAALAVHQIQRAQSLFVKGNDGVQYADPVECLLDLHEARLESLAQELLQFLIDRRKSMLHENGASPS